MWNVGLPHRRVSRETAGTARSVLCHHRVSPGMQGATKENVARCPLFIKAETPASEMKDGKLAEVWYRDPETHQFTQKFDWKGGTAFVVTHNNHLYLVTAKHVAAALADLPDDLVTLVGSHFAGSAPWSGRENRAALKGAKWFQHTSADVAVHPLPEGTWQNAGYMILDETAFWPETTTASVMEPVYLHGFPLGIGAQAGEFLPVAKTMHVASWMTSLPEPSISPALKFILVDEPIAQGYSGAPVFAELPSQTLVLDPTYEPPVGLIGIAQGTESDVSGGKLGVVVPVRYLRELLASTEVSRFERENPTR